MARYEFLETDSDDYTDFLVDARFERTLHPLEVTQILELCTNLLSSEIAQKLFLEGLSSIKLNLETLELVFRFSKRDTDIGKLSTSNREDLSRGQVQFVCYFLASIDKSIRLGEVPFPDNFRDFITFPVEFTFSWTPRSG